MTRIVGGVARGRQIAVPPGRATRPTSDRTREALFSTLESMRGGLSGARVLDLYAGSGAIGLEAISRGAAYALLVEANPRVTRVIRTNIKTLGFGDREAAAPAYAEVLTSRAERLAATGPPGPPFDVVFADPPYDMGDERLRAVLSGLRDNGWLAPDAIVVVERSSRGPSDSQTFVWPSGIAADRSRRYGETTLWYGRAGDQRT